MLTQGGGTFKRLLHGPARWLRAVPIADPVDLRNAPMFQVVLLLFGTLPVAAWLYRAIAVPDAWRPGELTSLALSVLFSAVALLGVVLIRFGRFRWAAYQTLCVFAISVLASYAASGFGGQRFEQPVLVVPMAIAALAVGRPALWMMFAAVLLSFALGTYVDLGNGKPRDYIGDAVISGVIFLLIAVVLDRTSAALRQSLREAQARAEQLGIAHESLRREVQERQRIEEQLVNAKKVEAVARLASGLNHDFNHLLSLVLGYVRQGRRASDAQAVGAAFDGVEAAARRATALSAKLLSFSRQDESHAEALDLGELVATLQPLLKQALKPGIALEVQVPPGLQVHFDRQQLELILLNLVANADDAMQHGGTVTLHGRRVGGEAWLQCRDTGPGIPAALREKIFEPFFTTKPVGHGTGLGLAMANGLMQRHGARIWVDAETGAGAAFVLSFPHGQAQPPALADAKGVEG
ncbi:ATP-binding protein [Xanthomonas sp. AM6]|uniref:sensor histidine kinase n=1 Tax=Xanthomonas sp. AM6 TaxID=2982531 RepID=UPI0021DB34DA|nr:ATP-binding protein [Xanthomonas sp. AM6]UYB52973.1 ATP-binding protein [Xanthomonas sp. AM6]